MNPSLPPHVQYQQQNQHPQHPQQHSQLSQHQHGQHQQPQSHGHLMPGQDYQGIYDDNAQLRTFQQLQQQQQQQVQQLQQQQQQTQQQLQQLQAAAAAGASQRMQFKTEDGSNLGYGGNGGAGNVAMNMGGGNMGGGNMGGGNMGGGGNMAGANMGGGGNMAGSNMGGANMTGGNMTGAPMATTMTGTGSLSPGMSEANNLHSKYLENEIIKTFPNKSELVKYVKHVLNDEEQCRIVINSSKPKAIYFQCERSGQFRTTVKDSSRRQRVAYTKRSKCAYRLVANLYPPDKDRRRLKNEPGREQLDKLHSFDSNDDSNQEMWILRMINPNHNHPPEPPVVTKKKRSKSARMLVEKPLPRSAHAAAHAAAAAAAGGPGMGPGAGPGPGGASAGYPGAADVMNSHHYSAHTHHNPGTTQSSQGNNHSGHQQDLHDPDVLAAITNPAAAALVNQPPVDPAIDPNVDPSVQEQDHIR